MAKGKLGSGKSKVISENTSPFVKGGSKHMAKFTGSGTARPGLAESDTPGKRGYSPAKGGKGHMVGFMGSGTVKPGVSEAASHAPRGPASKAGRRGK